MEWLSFLHRYVPAGLLEHKSADLLASRGSTRGTYLGQPIETVDLEQLYAQTMNQRPPSYFGRSDMETLLASPHSEDWIRISEMFLGPVKENFHFIPKHKSNSYAPTTSTSAGASGNEVPTEPVDSVIDEDPNNG